MRAKNDYELRLEHCLIRSKVRTVRNKPKDVARLAKNFDYLKIYFGRRAIF